jgi:RNA polymerase sigma-70 factor (ECF subfamily)
MVENPNLSDKAQQDYKLVLQAREGDQKAYAELMGRYKESIYYMVLKMVNNSDDADDLTIEAFGKAFKNIDQYSPQFAFSTWLFKIATNNSIDFLRKKRGITVSIDRTDDEGNEYQPAVPDKGLTPEEHFIKNQKVQIMRSIVKSLKPRYRSLIELRYFKELSYEEISQELELPLGTVKAQLFRARELLLNILQNKAEKI